MKHSSYILDWLSKKIEVDQKQVENLRENLSDTKSRAGLIYVLRRTSRLQQVLISRVLRRFDLPAPEFILRPENAGEIINSKENGGRVGIISLRNRTGHETSIRRIRKNRRELLDVVGGLLSASCDAGAPPYSFVPLSLFAGFGPRPVPAPTLLPIDFSFLPLGDLWLLYVYIVHRKELVLDVGEAYSPKKKLKPKEVVRRLSVALYRKEKMARGAKRKAQPTIEAIVLSGKRFEQILFQRAQETSASREQVYSQAKRIFQEIAATMKGGAIKTLYYIVHPMVKAVFRSVEIRNIDTLRNVAARYPTIIVPSHRSHFDYLLVSWLMYHARMPLPYVAAGDNLNFWPVGKVFKAAGAFFIRRKIEDDQLYKLVLDNYLAYLVKNGHLLVFFIEGGRSRSGGMRAPRLGLLKYLLRSWEQGVREDIYIVPLGISYERIAEEDSLCRELAGEEKRKESLRGLVRQLGIWRRRFGAVMLEVGDPFSLKSFRADAEERSSSGDYALSDYTEDLGFALSRRIMECTSITGTALAATAVLCFPNYRNPESAVIARMLGLLQIDAVMQALKGAENWTGSDKILDGEASLESTLQKLSVGGVLASLLAENTLNTALREVLLRFAFRDYVELVDGDGGVDIEVPLEARLKLEYYKNNILHYFIAPAILGQCLPANQLKQVDNDSLGIGPIERLHTFHQLFKPFFLFPFWRFWSPQLEALTEKFAAIGWVDSPGGISFGTESSCSALSLSKAGSAFLAPLGYLLVPLLEVLSAAISVMKSCGREPIVEEELLSEVRAWFAASGAGGYRTESSAQTQLNFAVDALLANKVLSLRRESPADKRMKSGKSRSVVIEEENREELERIDAFLSFQLLHIRKLNNAVESSVEASCA